MKRRYLWRRVLGVGIILVTVYIIRSLSTIPRSRGILLENLPEPSRKSQHELMQYTTKRAHDEHAPDKGAPVKVAPDKGKPDKRILDKRTRDNGASDKRTLNKVVPVKVAPDEGVPVKVAPVKGKSDKGKPDKRTINKQIRDNGAPGKRAPVKHAPVKRVRDVNCAAIMSGRTNEINKAKQRMKLKTFRKTHRTISDAEYIKHTQDCDRFIKARGYFDFKAEQEEKDFPIAFTIFLHTQVEQAERLLRAIYRPFNIYCLNVDADAKSAVHDAINGIANCFPNVIVVPRKEHIVYAGFTRLQADINCMKALLQSKHSWKYFLNLPSQSFPIKTNSEMVKILKIYNGFNDIEGITGRRRRVYRYKYKHIYKRKRGHKKAIIIQTNQLKDDPPYNVTVVKGSAYGMFSRKFVEFVCTSKVARGLLKWFRDVKSPDEYFWATLNHNPRIGAPGAFTGKPEAKPFLATFVAWRHKHMKCSGKFVRGICIFGVGDVHTLVSKKELFVNKFHLHYQPYALDCLEEWHHNRSAVGRRQLNMDYYKALPFNKH